MSSIPKVSVSIITYNHEAFIAKAIDSVLEQRTDFKFEIIIGDDCSSDGTATVLKEYQKKYPDIIHLILHPKRYGGVPGRLNNITNLYACRGEYVAMLDGDDYWLETDKLQVQVDFMEKNTGFAVVANEALKVNGDGDFTGGSYNEHHSELQVDNSFTQKEVLEAGWCLVQTSSLMFRNKMFKEFPEWFWKVISADFALLLLMSQFGKIKYFKKPYTAYRIHEDSFMSQYFFSKKILALKVAELQLLRKHFLPYGQGISGLKNVKTAHTLNRKIAVFKYSYAAHIKKDRGTIAALAFLIKSSFSNFSGYFLARKAMAKAKQRLIDSTSKEGSDLNKS